MEFLCTGVNHAIWHTVDHAESLIIIYGRGGGLQNE